MKQVKMTFICDQNWDDMKPSPDGRFCDLCKHEVIDFSEKTNHEMDQILQGRTGELCGRFKVMPDPNILSQVTTPRPFKMAAFFGSLLFAISVKTLNAQASDKPRTEQTERNHANQTQPDTIYIHCDSSAQHMANAPDKPKPFLTTKRKEYYWTKKFPFITKTYKPQKLPIMMTGRFL